MRVLLIGGTGYIGQEVTRRALGAGHQVRVLSRSQQSDEKLDRATLDAVQIIRGSVGEVELIVSEAGAADAVVYLAVQGFAGGYEGDVTAIGHLLGALDGTGKTFVLTSGMGVYAGTTAAVITPTSPTDSVIPSQAWRADLERTVLDAQERGIRTVIVRPSIVYGNGGSSPVITGYLEHVANGGAPFHLASGQNAIATVHVRDLAKIFVGLLDGETRHRSINVATGSVLGLDLAHATADLLRASTEPVSYTMEQAVAAMGPAGPMIGMDLRISMWPLIQDFALGPLAPTFLETLASGDLHASRSAGSPAPLVDQ